LAAPRESRLAVAALLGGALIWGLIWYPYRLLRDGGVDGVVAADRDLRDCVRSWPAALAPLAGRPSSWQLLWLALAAGVCNLGYVLATLHGEVVRVLLLFYLAPLWTVVLSRLLLDERLERFRSAGHRAVAGRGSDHALAAAAGLPAPQDLADWLGLLAGFAFALFNVVSRRARRISTETKVMAAFAGAVATGLVLLLLGIGNWRLPIDRSLWYLLGLVGGVLLLANLLVQFGLARVAANRAIVIMLSEIAVAALAAWLLAGEALAPREWIGGAIIVAASLFIAGKESGREA
jgi:drug/metabolite transporter (DMT)-like permease